MKEYKSTNGNGVKYRIRRAIENKNHFVVDVYFDNKTYPNIISGRYKRLKDAREAIGEYNTTGKFCFNGNI
jgi:hypothetical protein